MKSKDPRMLFWGCEGGCRGEKTGEKKDVHEADVGYLYRCREAAMYAADKMGWHVIKCAEDGKPLSIEKIAQMIIDALPGELVYA